jgi:hypothetical protein
VSEARGLTVTLGVAVPHLRQAIVALPDARDVAHGDGDPLAGPHQPPERRGVDRVVEGTPVSRLEIHRWLGPTDDLAKDLLLGKTEGGLAFAVVQGEFAQRHG